MIPHELEYLALLAVYLLIIASLFTRRVVDCFRSKTFWLSFAILGSSWTVIEWIGLRLGMWVYSEERTCGLAPLEIPVEEFIAFFLIHLATIASWKTFSSEYEAAR